MRKVLAVGSIVVVMLLVLTTFHSIVCAQTIKTNVNEKILLIQKNYNNKNDNLGFGDFIRMILAFLEGFLKIWREYSIILNLFRAVGVLFVFLILIFTVGVPIG